MPMNNIKTCLYSFALLALFGCNSVAPNSLTLASDSSTSALQTDQAADAVIGQDLYDTQKSPMVSGLGFSSLDAITSHGNTLFVADPTNFRILEFKDAHTMASGTGATGVIGQPDLFHYEEPSAALMASKMATAEDGTLFVYNAADDKVHVFTAPGSPTQTSYTLQQTPIPVMGMVSLPNNLLAIAGNTTVEFYSRDPLMNAPYTQAAISSPCSNSEDINAIEYFDSLLTGPNLLIACHQSIWTVQLDSETYFPIPLPYEDCNGSIAEIGNDTCNSNNNVPQCDWDNGDCCETTNPSCTSTGECDCQDTNACNGISCNAPPAPRCEGNTVISYNPTGVCSLGTCNYTQAPPTDCAITCNNGECVLQEDPCENHPVCTSPPPNSCSGQIATRYPNNGICITGPSEQPECQYLPTIVTCSSSEVCNYGFCVPKRTQDDPATLRHELYSSFEEVGDLASNSNGLFVLDKNGNRVLFYDSLAEHIQSTSSPQSPANANRIFGQPDANSLSANYHNLTPGQPSDQGLDTPIGLTLLKDSNQLWVADRNNFRVTRYVYSDPDNLADRVLGQSDYSHIKENRLILRGFLGIGAVELGYTSGVPYSLIVDPLSHRIVMHDGIDTYTSGSNPNEKVFGQSSITDYSANHGEDEPGADTLDTPVDVSVDPITGKIAIADYNNQRIVIYDNKDALSASQALGVSNLTSRGIDYLGFKALALRDNQLFVAVSSYLDGALENGFPIAQASRIFHYDIGENESSFVKPQRVFGQVYDETANESGRPLPANDCNRGLGSAAASHDTLCDVTDLYIDSDGTLWVADSGNHRILWFNSPTSASQVNSTTADGVVGQMNFQDNEAWDESIETASYQFRNPRGLGLDNGGGLWVTDGASGRILHFPTPKAKDSTTGFAKATTVIGNDMAAFSPRTELSSRSIAGAQRLAISNNGKILLVADTLNNRVLRFTHNLPPSINVGGTYSVKAGDIREIVIEVSDPEGDGLDPITIIEDPIPAGISLNGNTLSFSTANKAPNTSTRVHLAVTDQSPRKNTTTTAITFRVIDRPRTYERGEPPPERPLELPKSGCTSLLIPFEGIFLLGLYWMRRSGLRRRNHEQ